MARSDEEKRGAKYIQLALEGGAEVLRITVEQTLLVKNSDWPSWYRTNKEAVKDFVSSAAKGDDGSPSLDSLDVISLYHLLLSIVEAKDQAAKIGEFFNLLVEFFNTTDIAMDERDFDHKVEKLINNLASICTGLEALTRAAKSKIRQKLESIADRELGEISDEQVQHYIDMKQQMAKQMQKLTESNNNNNNNNDVNVKLFGTKVGKDKRSKYFVKGQMDETTAKSLILLDKGLGGGSVNVTMHGGEIKESKTGKVMFNDNKRPSSKKESLEEESSEEELSMR